jgi:hypothetical protein
LAASAVRVFNLNSIEPRPSLLRRAMSLDDCPAQDREFVIFAQQVLPIGMSLPLYGRQLRERMHNGWDEGDLLQVGAAVFTLIGDGVCSEEAGAALTTIG